MLTTMKLAGNEHERKLKCAICGKTQNVYYLFGEHDISISPIILCLVHRNEALRKIRSWVVLTQKIKERKKK